MALIGSIVNQGSLQGQINDANGYLTGYISNAGLLGGQVVAERGLKGDTGEAGADGQDGYSPSASVSKVDNVATITITDKDGTTTAEVYDGSGGGASAFIAEYGVTTYADVKDAYDEEAIIICTVDDSGNTAIHQLAYYDDANDIFYFAHPEGDGFHLASIAIDDTWDDGYFMFASTETATQLRNGLMSALDWQKLDGIASGAEVNVQSDWNEADSTADDYIKNKPAIPSATSTTPKMDGTAAVGSETTWAKGDHVHPTDTSRAASSHTHTKSDVTDFSHTHTKSEITDFPSLATVATSGSYTDLSSKPDIHNVPSGGTSGQVLSKGSNDDYDLAWATVASGGGGEIVYCTCTDSASTVAKTANIVKGSLDSLETGSQVAVKFTYTNTATDPTLNVNSTGAKAIMRGGTAHVGTNANESWNAGTVVYMLYDGSVWNIVGWLNTTYTGGTGAQIITGSEALNKVWSPQQIHDGIVGLADANVQSDWNEADTTDDAYIKNKPTIPSKTSDLNNDSGFVSADDNPAVFNHDVQDGSGKRLLNSGDITMEEHLIKSKLSVSSGSTSSGTGTATKADAVAEGIVGHRLANGTGSGGSFGLPHALYISAKSTGSATVSYGIRAVGGAVTNCDLYVTILWKYT